MLYYIIVIACHSDVCHLMMSYPCHAPCVYQSHIVTLESLDLADTTVLAPAGAMVSIITVPGKGCFELSLLLGCSAL